ncbi:molecular chaperone HtpG [Bacteriovoracaceae bacterium]|nr:molecular chaperone HtpG [Bacteriovoracaceae bacterium]
MSERKGNIKVKTTDILPIIKKWLYSEHDIFLRELISNGCDAITKREAVCRSMNFEIPKGELNIEIDKPNKLIRIIDNGIGMSEEEVEKYLANLAFSGAEEFVQNMKEMGADSKEDIIGKFGLGFYSVFMVADKVEVDTLSYKEGSKAVKWTSQGEEEYSFSDSSKNEIGTTITAHINDESMEFLDQYKSRGVINKYCDFMPYSIYLTDLEEVQRKEEEKKKKEEEKKDAKAEDKIEDAEEVTEEAIVAVNDTRPIWKKDPTTLKDEDYLAFYKKQFPMDPDPLFWIHLKVDHPFELLGVLYFPKLNPNKPMNEQNIRLYAKQVFVSDNVKNIIPEFLGLLKGHIDSPDIPLNVSRSSLQGDPNIKKISNYIIKKVAESLKKLFKSDREKYENIWPDIGLFVKYGCVSDPKFDEMMREFVIFKNAEDKYVTLSEYETSIPEAKKEVMKNKYLYYEKGKSDTFLRGQLKEEGIDSLETDSIIDPHFTQHVEMKTIGDDAKKFASLSSEAENVLTVENATEGHIKIKDLFSDILVGKKPETDEKEEAPLPKTDELEIEIKAYKNSKSAAYFKVDEQMKRFQQMTQSMGNQQFAMPLKKTLVVNPGNPLVQNAMKLWEKGENEELVGKLCRHIKDLAVISSEGIVESEDKDAFVSSSQELIQNLTSKLF